MFSSNEQGLIEKNEIISDTTKGKLNLDLNVNVNGNGNVNTNDNVNLNAKVIPETSLNPLALKDNTNIINTNITDNNNNDNLINANITDNNNNDNFINAKNEGINENNNSINFIDNMILNNNTNNEKKHINDLTINLDNNIVGKGKKRSRLQLDETVNNSDQKSGQELKYPFKDNIDEADNINSKQIDQKTKSKQHISDNPEIGNRIRKHNEYELPDILDGFAGYFESSRWKPPKTGKKIVAPALTQQEYTKYANKLLKYNVNDRKKLYESYKQLFPQWEFEMSQGFTVLLYGIGSKIDLLCQFATQNFHDLPVLMVNGYNPYTSFKEVLQNIASAVAQDGVKIPRSVVDLVEFIHNELESHPKEVELVILINNIDSECFRDDRVQTLLSRLVSCPQIYLAATIDHFNAPLLWDKTKSSLYNFIWHAVPTYKPYIVETSFSDAFSIFNSKSNSVARIEGIKHVLKSLTDNHRNLFRILLTYQLEAMSEADELDVTTGSLEYGVEFKKLYQLCLEEFIVSNEIGLRTMLTEFLTHQMAMSAKDSSGLEVIYLPYSKSALESILETNELTGEV